MPPLAKGRWPSEARSEGWLRCRQRYRCDRRVTTGTLQQKMGRIAPYTQRYYVPLRLHPPVSFADSPPCQGGPRGCCGVATIVQPCQRGRASCLPFIRGGGPPKAVEGSMPQTTLGRWVYTSDHVGPMGLYLGPRRSDGSIPQPTPVKSKSLKTPYKNNYASPGP